MFLPIIKDKLLYLILAWKNYCISYNNNEQKHSCSCLISTKGGCDSLQATNTVNTLKWLFLWQKSMLHMPVDFICCQLNSLHRSIDHNLSQINFPSALLARNSSTISLPAAVGERMSQPWCPGTSACWCSRTEEFQPQLQWWVQWHYQLQCQQQQLYCRELKRELIYLTNC